MENNAEEDCFHEILYQILIQEKQTPVKAFAHLIGIPESTFYAKLKGSGSFSAAELRQIIQKLPDVRLVNWLFANTKYIPVDRTDAEPSAINPFESLRRTALIMLIEASEAADQIETALLDNGIDRQEIEAIKFDIENAERAIATLREHVRQVSSK